MTQPSPKKSCGITIEPLRRNSHQVKYDPKQWFLFISDVHFDASKCDRDLLDKHMRQARDKGAAIFVFGDWFDLMQGKWDPRGNYSDLRPEYKSMNYLDAVIDDTIEYLTKYKDNICFLGRGNHETNIEKRMHTSPLDRVCAVLNERGGKCHVGGYSGWLLFCERKDDRARTASKVHYHHGYGGNAPRSKGVLRVDLDQAQFPDAQVLLRGHTHQKWYVPVTVDRVSSTGNAYQQTSHHVQMGSYKLLGDRFAGWAVEKGFNTPRMGGWWAQPKRCQKTERTEWTITEAS